MVPLLSELLDRLSVAFIEAGNPLREFQMHLQGTAEHEIIISDEQAEHLVLQAAYDREWLSRIVNPKY
jgi:hypothetical protein